MQLLVLGTGCAKCAKLHDLTTQAAQELGLDYQLEKITDLKQIMALGVMVTPALAVNGTIRVAGKVPSLPEIKAILHATGGGVRGNRAS